MAKKLGLTSGCVSDVLRRNGLKPHLVRTYKVSRDPDFAAKVKDVVGLYLNPPEHAVVLSVDEKTSIQALQRTQLPLPLRSGRAARHTHDYKRHGVVDLYAALEVATGNVTHRVTDAHTAADFLAFMKTVVRRYPRQELHVMLDNSSTHGTPDVQAWLAAESAGALPLHADERVVAESGRGLLRHPRKAVAQRHRLPFQACPARTHRRVHEALEPVPHALRLDQARKSHHQVTPPNAEAHLDGGALVRPTVSCRRRAS